MMEKKPRHLKKSLTVWCFLFAFVLSFCMGAMGFYVYEKDMLNRYHAYTEDILDYVARTIDGDDLLACMRSGKKSAKYQELQKLADDVKETHKVEYLYIIEPLSDTPPDNMMDVMAAYTQAGKEAGTDGLTDLGKLTGDAYPPDVARQYMARMDRDPKVTFFPNDTEFGNIYTAIRPIFDSHGNPIAVLCADVLIDEIDEGRRRFILMSAALSLLAGSLLALLMSIWLQRRVAHPIGRLKASAESFAERCHDNRDLNVLSFEDPDIHTGDEIEDLAVALSSMCTDMKSYTEELILADREMTSLKGKLAKLDTLAYKDTLTGAGNKAAYEKIITRLDWDILTGKTKFAMVMADLNYLKKINDTFGHDKGNIYIKNLYALLQEAFQESPIFRIGGDEFVVLAQEREYDHCTELLAWVKQRVSTLTHASKKEPWERISTALGIAFYDPERHTCANDVFKEADADMYKEKKVMHAERK